MLQPQHPAACSDLPAPDILMISSLAELDTLHHADGSIPRPRSSDLLILAATVKPVQPSAFKPRKTFRPCPHDCDHQTPTSMLSSLGFRLPALGIRPSLHKSQSLDIAAAPLHLDHIYAQGRMVSADARILAAQTRLIRHEASLVGKLSTSAAYKRTNWPQGTLLICNLLRCRSRPITDLRRRCSEIQRNHSISHITATTSTPQPARRL